MKTTKLTALIMLTALSLCLTQSYGGAIPPGTLLAVDAYGSSGGGVGILLLVDTKTGRIDTLIKDPVACGAVFSKDGRNVLYKHIVDGIDRGALRIININTRQIRTVIRRPDTTNVTNRQWYEQMAWPKDSIIYFAYWRWICRVNPYTKKVDSLYLVRGSLPAADSLTESGTYDMYEGNVSDDGKRAGLNMDPGGSGSVWSIDLVNKTEVNLSNGSGCQSSLSGDGNLVAFVTDHSTNFIKPFHSKDSTYRAILSPGGSIWMNRFSRNSNNIDLFHTDETEHMYLWQIDVNRYDAVTSRSQTGIGSVSDFYAGGWVLDTIPPAAPTGLHLAAATAHSITLAWSVPVASVVPLGYIIERNGVRVGETENTSFTDSVLSENTAYDYVVYGKTNGIVLSSPVSGRYSTVADHTPPSLVATFSYGNSVDLVFSEPLDASSAGSVSNYSLNGVTISAAALQVKNRVHLTTSAFTSLSDSFVHVTGIKDLAATPNTITRDSIPVTLIRNLTTTSGHTCTWTFLQTGVKYNYDDADIQLAQVQGLAPGMAGLPMLQTSVNDAGTNASNEFIGFTIGRSMEILVATDLPLSNVPSWLKDPAWRRTGEFIEQWNIYSRVFPAGTVSLKGNGNASAGFCYNVLFRPVNSIDSKGVPLQQYALSFYANSTAIFPSDPVIGIKEGSGAVPGLTVTPDSSWLHVTVSGTGEAQKIHHTAVVAGLVDGQTYSTRVTVTSAGYAATYYTVNVTSGKPPEFVPLQTKSLSFFADNTGSLPADPVVGIKAGSVIASSLAVTPDSSWLHVTVSGSGASQVIHHTVDVTGLVDGRTYSSNVKVMTTGYLTTFYTVSITVGVPRLQSLRITPKTKIIAPQTTAQFSIEALDQYGNTLTLLTKPGWSVSGGGGIDSLGLFKSNGEIGEFIITAGSLNNPAIKDDAKVTVANLISGKGGIEHIVQAASGRYVLFTGLERATGYGYSIYEFEVYSNGVNMALNKQVKVSSIEGGSTPGTFAVDGNSDTRWASARTDPQDMCIDLGQVMKIDSFIINWDPAYASKYLITVSMNSGTSSISRDKPISAIPKSYELNASPNPFTATTRIIIGVPGDNNSRVKSPVSLRIYNLRGQLVQTLAQGPFAAGYHTASFNGKNKGNGIALGNGIYFCRMQAPGFARTLKLLLVQ